MASSPKARTVSSTSSITATGPPRSPRASRRSRRAAASRGLAALPPRPTGRLERPGNAAAASRLEELAGALENAEHRLALFHAGVRWIDESGRDLAAIAREGNFRKVFPFGDEVAAQAEQALREAR